ncbi:FHA domain-containing protein, partial [Microbacterium sp. ZW T5_56]|uniref:FHA domain-containing protein n=1 Tax=Microbacterium sp. ZW T5_56 TaxID=3378081 RepID=UPI003853062E
TPASAAGATRMREDSEVVAAARRSAVPHSGAMPPASEPVVDPEEPYRPIVIPGPPASPVADSAFAPAMHRSEAPSELSESVLDYSQEVSAVVGAPDAGAPRAARESVSAQASEFVAALDDDDFEATELASRRRPVWKLTPPLGGEIVLTSEAAVLGRRPAETDERIQNVPVADGTRTVSKTHARLDLIDGVWWITDLASTNGVFLIDESGAEQELRSGIPTVLTERFLLGDAELRITRATA